MLQPCSYINTSTRRGCPVLRNLPHVDAFGEVHFLLDNRGLAHPPGKPPVSSTTAVWTKPNHLYDAVPKMNMDDEIRPVHCYGLFEFLPVIFVYLLPRTARILHRYGYLACIYQWYFCSISGKFRYVYKNTQVRKFPHAAFIPVAVFGGNGAGMVEVECTRDHRDRQYKMKIVFSAFNCWDSLSRVGGFVLALSRSLRRYTGKALTDE